MTVDEILTQGEYTDRRGRDWAALGNAWVLLDPWRWVNKPKRESMTTSEIRLLFERDMHECDGLGLTSCVDHPTVSVLQDPDTGFWLVFERYGIECVGREYREWSEAMDAAYSLAVAR